ncbi:MAG: FHA domain-containing protein [Eubacteriales bacterium]|nr:FHA domain-containing protein [Eubacteriales bacterium]
MELKKYKVCPSCGEHNKPTSLECRKCETDLTGVRVVDSEIEQRKLEKENAGGKPTDSDAGNDIQLVRVCEECGAENAPQARKCKQCGEEISDILPTPVLKREEPIFSFELKSVDGIFSTKIYKTLSIIGREADLKEYLGTKAYVSRQHAELTVVAGKVFIKNLSGTNKTFVNNEEISNDEPHVLANGDEIGLGGKVIADERQDNAAYFLFQG